MRVVAAMSKGNELELDHGTDSDFSDAEFAAKAAQIDFADMVEKFGGDRSPAYTLFCMRVSRWSNGFSDKRMRKFCYTLGRAMQGESHGGYISYQKLAKRYLKDHGQKVSVRTLIRYVERLGQDDIGIVRKTVCWQDERHDYPGMKLANDYEVSFWKILRYGQVLPHDFTAPLPAQQPECSTVLYPSVTKIVTKDVTKIVTKVGRTTVSPSVLDSVNPPVHYHHEPDDQAYPCGADQATPDDEHDATPSQPPSQGLASGDTPGQEIACLDEDDVLDGVVVEEPGSGGSLGAYIKMVGWEHSLGRDILLTRMEEVAASQDLDMDFIAEGVAWWLCTRNLAGKSPGYLIASLPTIPDQFRSAKADRDVRVRAQYEREDQDAARVKDAEDRKAACEQEKKDAADKATQFRVDVGAEIDAMVPGYMARQSVQGVEPDGEYDFRSRCRNIQIVLSNLAKDRDALSDYDFRDLIVFTLRLMKEEMALPDEAPPAPAPPPGKEAPNGLWFKWVDVGGLTRTMVRSNATNKPEDRALDHWLTAEQDELARGKAGKGDLSYEDAARIGILGYEEYLEPEQKSRRRMKED
jgi:hypothetical protein